MINKKSTIPVLVGAAQYTQQKNTSQPLDPIGLMTKTSRAALNDADANGLRELIDTVYVINIFGWTYRDAPGDICNALGLNAAQKIYTVIGGNTPQTLVNRAADAIARGECETVLITGGEAEYSVRKAKKNNTVLDWPERQKPELLDDAERFPASDIENHYGLSMAIDSYAVIETALRAVSGRTHEEHNSYIGKQLEALSRIASKNPYAWTQIPYLAEEIYTATSENRKITYPYTKRMISNISVDQSASLIMTNEETADKLGIDPRHRVYPIGGADIENIFHLTRRPLLYNSPAIKEAARLAFEQANLSLDDIDMFDLYSCFPCMVEIARKEIGIPENDPRDMTVAGGLPFFGGPFNSYSTHAIVEIINRIRKNPSLKAMLLANGGVNTKQSVGIYSSKPSANQWGVRDDSAIQNAIWNEILPEPVEKASGKITIEAYTMSYTRDGVIKQGMAVGLLEDGSRALAIMDDWSEVLTKFEKNELVGKTMDIYHDRNTGHSKVKPDQLL